MKFKNNDLVIVEDIGICFSISRMETYESLVKKMVGKIGIIYACYSDNCYRIKIENNKEINHKQQFTIAREEEIRKLTEREEFLFRIYNNHNLFVEKILGDDLK